MAGDFNKPVVTDAYASVLQSIRDLIADLAKGLDGTGTANAPVNTIRWSSTNNRFEKYNGSSWAALTSAYAISISGNAATATSANSASSVPWSGITSLPTTLSGFGITDALQLTTAKTAIDKSNTDLNVLTAAGFYRGSNMTNAPDSGWWFVLVQGHDNTSNAAGWCSQIAVAYGSGNTAGVMKKRQQSGAAGVWSSWVTVIDTDRSPGALSIGAAGTYGGINITGAANGWAGFQFNSSSRYFMSSSGQTGEYDTSAGVWQWRWDSGTLAIGTVPWNRLSGVPAMSFLGLTGGTVSGAITSTVEGENNVFVSSGDIGGAYVNWNTNRKPALQVDAADNTSAYMIWRATKWGERHLAAMDAYAGGSSSSTVRVDLHVGSTNTFQFHGTGQIYTANYGWLHDYFFNNITNCGNSVVDQGAGNIVSAQYHELVDNGGNMQLRQRRILTNCNCNCGC